MLFRVSTTSDFFILIVLSLKFWFLSLFELYAVISFIWFLMVIATDANVFGYTVREGFALPFTDVMFTEVAWAIVLHSYL